jgi:tetratricopeptide (TPR) repeat protein
MSSGARRHATPARAPAAGRFRRAEAALRLADADPRQARAQAERVLAEASRAGDELAAAQAERALGMAARTEQDVLRAAEHLGRAVRLAEHAGSPGLAAHSRISRALALAYAGRMAAAHAELDRAGQVLDGPELARVDLQRAGILQLEGRLEEADERLSAALPPLSRAGDLAALAVLYNNRGLLRSRRGWFGRAATDLHQAVALHGQLGHEAAAAEASQNLGLLAAWRGDLIGALEAFDEVDQRLERAGAVDAVGLLDRSEALLTGRLLVEARQVAERAVREHERLHLSAYLDHARLVLARIELYEQRYEQARALAEQSAQAFRRQRRPSYRALAEEVAVQAGWRSGERTPALLAASRRAAAALQAGGWTVAAADARLVAAQVAVALGRTAVARAELAGLTVPRRTDPAELRSRAFYARALGCLIEGDRRRAEAALRAGLAVLERQRRDLGGTDLRVYAAAYAADLATLGLRLAAEDGDPGRVLQWAERWRANTLSMPPVRPPRDEQMSEALAELRRLQRTPAPEPARPEPARPGPAVPEPAGPEPAGHATGGHPAAGHGTAGHAVAGHATAGHGTAGHGTAGHGTAGHGAGSGSAAATASRQAALERTVRRLARRAAAPTRYEPQRVTVAALRAVLGEQALIELVDVAGTLHAVVVTRRGRSLHELGTTLAATRLVITQRFWLRRLVHRFGGRSLEQTASAATAAARDLDQMLLRPLHRAVDGRPVVIIPTAALHTVAWAALPSLAGQPVSVAPSAGWWQRAAAAATPAAAGAPGGRGRTVLVSGPGLPHGATEVAALREVYPQAVALTGADATTRAVGDALDCAALAHIAAHGRFRADQPLLSCLQLADGPMFVYDLERLRTAPRVLVLASCDAGLTGVLPGDELMGMAAAVLAQGTTALVAPILPVADADTKPVMLALHRRLAAGLAPADALADVRRTASGAPHELTAALFTCIGAG